MSEYTACFRCGETGHYERQCTAPPSAEAPGALQATPKYPVYLDAGAYRRPASEISPPTDEYRRAREQISGGTMPLWLRKRMDAWHQVVESRRDPFNVHNQQVMADNRRLYPLPQPIMFTPGSAMCARHIRIGSPGSSHRFRWSNGYGVQLHPTAMS